MLQEWGILLVPGDLCVACAPCPPGAAQSLQVSRAPSVPCSFLQGHNILEHPGGSDEYGEEGPE